ncbi:hypothetical protein [Bradyrhizobium sp. 35]|uniref:hypothetical protein n=1 Tax=Bradyrhizobium sp. 35 TaxID=2782670 RepID=UPI0023EE8E6D|nr:hypothetical protein [Bradyrhizobium sp. 35]
MVVDGSAPAACLPDSALEGGASMSSSTAHRDELDASAGPGAPHRVPLATRRLHQSSTSSPCFGVDNVEACIAQRIHDTRSSCPKAWSDFPLCAGVSLRTARLFIKRVRSNDLKQCKMYDPGAVVMYGRVNNWPDIPAEERYHRAANAEEAGAESQGFADAFARTRLQESAESSPSQPSYSLVRKPPVVEIDRATFRTEVRTFHSDAINRIANNPHEYSEFVSARAKRTAEVAREYGIRRDSEDARYYSYQLGNVSVGLQRTEAGFNMSEFESDKWREQFPGRSEVTSIVDFQVAHPLVANAGDILLEHQLRQDGERPLVNWRPANAEAKARAETMGFVEVDEDDMVLDPTQSAQWTKNSLGEWQRATKSQLYLSKVDSDTELAADSEEDGDFM